jgi:hypothetical protein
MERADSVAFPVLHRSGSFVVVLFLKPTRDERKHEMIFFFSPSGCFVSSSLLKN